MALRTIIICTGLSLSVLVACGGSGKKYLVPVDSPEFKPFEAPEDDEFDGDEDDWDSDDDDDEDDGSDATEPVAPVPTPAPPPKATKVKPPAKAPATTGGGAVKAVVSVGESKATGDLDKKIIQRYIRRKVPAIKTCYERELIRNPKLAGTVRAVFTITPTGTVKDVASSGMAIVDACVGKVVGAIVFPKPKNGGTVRVSYPFVFKSSN